MIQWEANVVLEIDNDSYWKYSSATLIETCRTEISKKNVRLYLGCLYNNKLVWLGGRTLNVDIKISTSKLHHKLGELFALQVVRTRRCHLCVQQPQKKSATYVSKVIRKSRRTMQDNKKQSVSSSFYKYTLKIAKSILLFTFSSLSSNGTPSKWKGK